MKSLRAVIDIFVFFFRDMCGADVSLYLALTVNRCGFANPLTPDRSARNLRPLPVLVNALWILETRLVNAISADT